MAAPDEPVHPGGLKIYRAKKPKLPTLAKPPSPEKINAEVKEDAKAPLTQAPAMRLMFKALRGASGIAKKSPASILDGVLKVVKTAGAEATTTQVAQSLKVAASPWEDPDVHPILLLRDMTRAYGKEWLSWEPETLWSEIRDDDGVFIIPRVNKDKIMAVRLAVKTDLPWKRLDLFENVSLAFAGLVPRFDMMQPLEPYQVAFGVDVLYRIHPGIEYDDDVKGYIAAILVHDGLSWVPPDLFGDVEPMMKSLRNDEGVADEVRKAWDSGTTPDEDSAAGSQIATLSAIKDYLDEMDGQLELTKPLKPMEYDAEADPTMPNPPAIGISAAARAEA